MNKFLLLLAHCSIIYPRITGHALLYLIIGDIHSKSLENLHLYIKTHTPDVLINLGDFDCTQSLCDFIKIEKELKKLNKKVITVPGNHDDAVFNLFPISSREIIKHGKNIFELHEELKKNKKAFAFMKNLFHTDSEGSLNTKVHIYLDQERYNQEYPALIIHGGYTGSLDSFPECPVEKRDFWYRFITIEDYRSNFQIMEEKGYKIMIRGHDHETLYAYEDPKKGITLYNEDTFMDNKQHSYRLFKERKHIINPGALCHNIFALIDTHYKKEEVPVLTYIPL